MTFRILYPPYKKESSMQMFKAIKNLNQGYILLPHNQLIAIYNIPLLFKNQELFKKKQLKLYKSTKKHHFNY